MNRALLIVGALLILVGMLWPWLSKVPWGRLPGDFLIERGNFSLYLPVTTGVLISAMLRILFWLFRK